jgi:hypothetical protein
MWDFVFRPSAFPSRKAIEQLQKDFDGDNKVAAGNATEELLRIGEDIWATVTPPLRHLISVAVVIAVDKAFRRRMGGNPELMGTDDNDQILAYLDYRDDVQAILAEHVVAGEDHKEKLVVDTMDAKLQYILHPSAKGFMGYWPIPTPSVPLHLQQCLTKIDDATKEVSEFDNIE